ncbi:hypothetical protein HK101_005791 [Irineochytrium annulatum]|nr:hypothetical protein HK101_005791 [Irineochytrium annulatum]
MSHSIAGWPDRFYQPVSVLILIAAAAIFPTLLFARTAAFGRFSHGGSRIKVPGKLAWLIFEGVSLIGMPTFFLLTAENINPVNGLLLFLFTAHYTNRAIVYVVRAPSIAPAAIEVILAAIAFNLPNSFVNAYAAASVTEVKLKDPLFPLGILLFVIGFCGNVYSDEILRRLRTDKRTGDDGVVGKNGKRYYIPRGGAFKWVTSANYMWECVEWLGWAIAVGRLGPWAFFVFTVANLAPRARATHHWYKTTFGGKYPEVRRAILPYVW